MFKHVSLRQKCLTLVRIVLAGIGGVRALRHFFLILFFCLSTLLSASAQEQTTKQERLDEIAAEMKRVTEAMIDGSLPLEEAAKRLTELSDLDLQIRSGQETNVGVLKETEEGAPPVMALDLGLDPETVSVVPAGSVLRIENVPWEFEGDVWLRPKRGAGQSLKAMPDFDRLDFDPDIGTSAWLVPLPYDAEGTGYLDFEGLAHTAIDLKIAPAEPVVGSFSDRMSALDSLLQHRLQRLGWSVENAVSTFQNKPATLPIDVSQLAMYYFAIFSDQNPINLVELLEIERDLSDTPDEFDEDVSRLFDTYFPIALLMDRAEAAPLLPKIQYANMTSGDKAQLWQISTAGTANISFEQMLDMLVEGDKDATRKNAVDGLGSAVSGTGIGALGPTRFATLLADITFALVSSELRDKLHNSPRHLEISADFADRSPRKINDRSCMPLVVKVTAYSDPKIDLVYSQSGKSAELMAKIVVASIEAILNRPEFKAAPGFSWVNRKRADNAFIADEVATKVRKIRENAKINPLLLERLPALTKMRKSDWERRFAVARADDWSRAVNGLQKKAADGRLKVEQATKVKLVNKVIKQALKELEARGGPALEIRRTPAKVWGPYTLTPEQISNYIELESHRGPVRIGKDGCITTCWQGRDEPFSIGAKLRVNKGKAFGYGYRVKSSLARGQFAPAKGRIAFDSPTVSPGGGVSASLEMDNALPGTVRFGVVGSKGRFGPVVDQSGTFIAPESINSCSQKITVTAQLEQDPESMCAPAPMITGVIDVRDPDARIFMPQELICKGSETLPFSVRSPSGNAQCTVSGAGAVSGNGSAFNYSCQPGKKPASVTCTDGTGSATKSCAPTMNIRYAKEPGIAAAAYVAAGGHNAEDWLPAFSATQLLKPRLRVLADTEPPRPDEIAMPGGARLVAEYREPTPESNENFESVAAPVKAEQINISRSGSSQNTIWHYAAENKSSLSAQFFHGETLGLSVVANIREDIKAFEQDDDAITLSPSNLLDSEVDFAAFIPIDNGGPEINAVVMLNAEVSGSGNNILVTGHSDDPENRSFLHLQSAVRIISQEDEKVAKIESSFLGGLPFAHAPPHLGSKRGLSTFAIPEAPLGTPRGVLVRIEGGIGERDIKSRQPGVIRGNLGRGTALTSSTSSSLSLEVELLEVFKTN